MNPKENKKKKNFFKGSRNRFFYKTYKRDQILEKGNTDGRRCNTDCEFDIASLKQNVTDSEQIKCPYQGWDLYFSGEDYSDDSVTVEKVKAVESVLRRNPNLYSVDVLERTLNFPVDVKVFTCDETFKKSWSTFEDELENNPSHVISCIGLAIHQVVAKKLLEENLDFSLDSDEYGVNLPMIHARILNSGPILRLRNLKSNYFGKLITIKGSIIRVSNIKLTCVSMAFRCDSCVSIQCLKQVDGNYSMPSFCVNSKCKGQSFCPLLSSPHTKTLNWQCVRLQEIILEESGEGGRVPRNIDCELTADLVDCLSPGDVAIMTGIFKIRKSDEGLKVKNSNVFHHYMEVVSLVNCTTAEKGGTPEIELSEKNYYGIQEIYSEKNLFRLIVHSLCPTIFGHEIVKAGLVLAIFGGCYRYEDSRANPHLLIVGDPGLGKSQMLQACASVAPRSVYICGNTSTTSGLTVTLGRESGGDYVLEAGALVLSDQGCCCIDEFDKMSSQHQALLEAMELQTVSIAKSGVVCVLPCRTSILAAANPVGGHYNKSKTVSQNLRLGPSLLSRFDLVFILMDQPSMQTDILLSDHVMAMHSGSKGTTSVPTFSNPAMKSPLTLTAESLSDKLKLQPGEELDLIPHQLLRKYIAYAKQYVKPKLTTKATEILMNFYLELRRCHQDSDSTPVTPRQLESLIRFTEARAKLELREEATESDAKDVIEILRHSLLDMFTDEYGNLDFTRSQNGSGMSRRSQAKQFISELQKRSEFLNKSVFSVEELREIAKQSSVTVSDFSNFLSTLNVQGYLMKKGSNIYQLLSTD